MCHLYPFVGFVEVVLFCGCILDKRRLMFVYCMQFAVFLYPCNFGK